MRALLFGLALVLSAGPAHARGSAESVLANEPSGLFERLQTERTVVLDAPPDGIPDSWVVAYVLFARPRDEVKGLMRLAERQPEYRTELASVETVRVIENGRIDEQRIQILFKEFVYRLRYLDDPETGRMEWTLDPDFDNDFRDMRGFWELYEFKDGTRTLGRFGSHVDVGAVPAFLQSTLSRKTVIQYMQNCQRWIDSNGRWRP